MRCFQATLRVLLRSESCWWLLWSGIVLPVLGFAGCLLPNSTAEMVSLMGVCLPSAGTAPRVPTGARWQYGFVWWKQNTIKKSKL